MKILITGGSGFIGTNVVQFYLDKGEEVLSIDCISPKKDAHQKFFSNVDLEDEVTLEKVIIDFNPDYIIHLAARTDLDGKSLDDYSANTKGVENILKIAYKCSGLKKILITSSMLVCHAGYYPKDQFDYAPTTLYGESKVKTEEIVCLACLIVIFMIL